MSTFVLHPNSFVITAPEVLVRPSFKRSERQTHARCYISYHSAAYMKFAKTSLLQNTTIQLLQQHLKIKELFQKLLVTTIQLLQEMAALKLFKGMIRDSIECSHPDLLQQFYKIPIWYYQDLHQLESCHFSKDSGLLLSRC